MAVLPREALGASTAPFSDAARVLAGEWAGTLVALGAVISCFGALNGWILLTGQLPMAIASDGLFPRVFGTISARGVPARGIVISGALATILIAMNYSRRLVDLFTFIILLATLSTLVPYVFSALATFILPEDGETARPPRLGGAIVAALAFAYSLWAIAGAGAEVVYWGFLLLIAGLPVYVWVESRKGAKTEGLKG
jgi:APA family basic amino acid/polyamine antiporter